MKMIKLVAAAAAMLGSTAAIAGVTGNAGAFSEYVFRGVEQSGGAAVQGGLDWATDSGFYLGTWISNTNFGAGADNNGDGVGDTTVSYETDVYTGFAFKAGSIGFDLGALYYYYRDETSLNTLELYAGVSAGPVTVKAFFTDDYFGTDEAGTYVTASAALPLSDSLTLTPQIGTSTGDGPEIFFGNAPGTTTPDGEYIDYSLTLSKTADNGFTFSLAVIGTDLDTTAYANDKEKIVVGLKKSFEL